MKLPILLLAMAATQIATAQSAGWSVQTYGIEPGTGYFALDLISTIEAGPSGSFQIDCWPTAEADFVDLHFAVFSSDGAEQPQVITTGPGLSFMKSVTIAPRQKRRFSVFRRFFEISKSGWYIVKGKSLRISSGGHLIDLPLTHLRFYLEVPAKKKSGQNPT